MATTCGLALKFDGGSAMLVAHPAASTAQIERSGAQYPAALLTRICDFSWRFVVGRGGRPRGPPPRVASERELGAEPSRERQLVRRRVEEVAVQGHVRPRDRLEVREVGRLPVH